MKNKNNIVEVKADFDDLMCMFGGALRYALGRQTYMPGIVQEVIVDNLPLYNEKWVINFLNDLTRYEKDTDCDLQNNNDHHFQDWMNLKRKLLTVYMERGYTRPVE